MESTRVTIFDDFERTAGWPAEHRESSFGFLNRVAGDFWTHPRLLVQDWADHLASNEEYRETRARLRSGNDYQFRSAFLELYLHEWLLRTGHEVTVHPPLAHSTRRPDFYAQRDGSGFYLEAIAPAPTPQVQAAQARVAVMFDTVNRLGHPKFFLWLTDMTEGTRPPAAAALRRELFHWLDGLDPEDFDDLDSAPEWHWRRSDWSATFKAIPKSKHARGTRPSEFDQAIGVYGHRPAEFVNDAPTIRAAISAKDRAYGRLGAPYIIAVGTYMFDRDRWHSTNALYGHDGIQFTYSPTGERVTRNVRQDDGYFGVPPTWRHDNVSGVLLVNQLQPYHLTRAEVTLWHHPAPLHPLPMDLQVPGDVIRLLADRLDVAPPSQAPAELFGLVEPWPPGEPWTR